MVCNNRGIRSQKIRGFGKNRARTVNNERVLPLVINLNVLEASFNSGETVSPATLLGKGVITTKKGKVPQVKILGNGELTKKITLSGCLFSTTVKAKIEKVGGSVL